MYTFFLVWVVLISMCVALRLGKSYSVLGLVVVVAGVVILIPSYLKIVAITLTIGWLILSIKNMLAGLTQRHLHTGAATDTQQTATHQYRPEIDGLRAFAIIPVVIYHAFPALLPGGFVGVDVFFVISGFLITQILIEQNAKGTFTYVGFYERRVRRIFPALMVVLVSVLVAGWFVLFNAEYMDLITHSLAGSLFVSNLLLYSQVGYFAQSSYALPLLHLWSLGIEEQFYIFWPFVVTILRKNRTGLLWTFIGLCVASFVTTQYLHTFDDDAAFYWPISRFWELGIGGIAAWIVSSYTIAYEHPRVRTIASELSWVGLILLCIGFVTISDATVFPGYSALIPTIGAFMLILAGGNSWVSRVLFGNKYVVFIGLISYPLYLWHWPILSFGSIYFENEFSVYLRIAAICLSVLLAFVTFALLERRVRAARESTKVIPTRQIIVVMAGIVAIAAIMLQSDVTTILTTKMQRQTADTVMAQVTTRTNRQTCADASFETVFQGNCTVVTHPDSARTQYIIIGDSIAMAMSHALLDRATDHPVILMWKSACPPLPGMERFTESGVVNLKCSRPQGTTGIFETLKKLPADRNRVIFLVGRYTAINEVKFNPNRDGVFRLKYRDRPFPTSPEQKQRDFRDSVIEMFEITTKIPRAKVVFVYQTPELPFAPKYCIMRNLIGGTWGCAIPRTDQDAFFSQYRNIVDDVLRDYPQVDIIDPMKMFCDADNCYAAKDGQLLYEDDIHVNILGAQLITKGITDRYP
jgi:peptidoglycan/LPS O-acetylase OafA/YrhL